MPIKPLLLSCFLILLSGCATIKNTVQGHNDTDPLVNNIVWEVTSFKGRTLNARDFNNGIPTITFYMQDGKIGGNDGCNNFMGIAAYHGNTIKTGAIATTKMNCPDSSTLPDLYTLLSSPGLTYHLNDGILRLFVNDAEIMALKERE